MWSAPNDFNLIPILFEFEGDLSFQYWSFFYNAVLFMAGNEVGPRTDAELTIVSFLLIIDLIIAANIFGEVAVLVLAANRR